jgi:hypothetical protein
MPNPHNAKFVSVTGILAGMMAVGTLKRFYADIASVTFLGAEPLTNATKGKYLTLVPILQTRLTHFSATPTPKGKRKAAISFKDKQTPTKKASCLEVELLRTE